MTSNIQVETQKDRVINTTPSLRIDMSNIEVAQDEPSGSKLRVEIPERRRRRDSDASEDANDYTFLVNTKKFSQPKDIPEITPLDSSSQQSDPRRDRVDTESEKSQRSSRSRKRSRSRDSHRSRRSDVDSEYKARYPSSVLDGIGMQSENDQQQAVISPPLPAPTISSFLNNNIFSRKSSAAMTDDEIRREKSHYLQQYESKNKDNMYSTKRLTMNNDLEEIKDELEFIMQKRSMENSMVTWKRGLLLFVDSAVAVNSAYDPFDVDLTDWSKEMHWDVFRAGKYDEVLDELIVKWKGKMPMAPEWKLMFMMGSSLVFGVMAKKKEKAAMAKRLEEEKMMEEKIRAQVRAEIANVQNMQYAQGNGRQNDSGGGNNGYTMPVPRERRKSPRMKNVPEPEPMFAGPSTDAEIIKRMEANFIDSTIAGDDSSISSDSTNISLPNNTTILDNVSIGSRKSKASSSNSTKKQEKEDETNIITVPTTSIAVRGRPPTRGTGTGRGRGRPRKNPQPDNAVTLEL